MFDRYFSAGANARLRQRHLQQGFTGLQILMRSFSSEAQITQGQVPLTLEGLGGGNVCIFFVGVWVKGHSSHALVRHLYATLLLAYFFGWLQAYFGPGGSQLVYLQNFSFKRCGPIDLYAFHLESCGGFAQETRNEWNKNHGFGKQRGSPPTHPFFWHLNDFYMPRWKKST